MLNGLLLYIDAVLEAFEIKWLMFETDRPVCLMAAEYTTTLSITQQYFKEFSSAEIEDCFAKNAIDFYKLND